MMTTPNDLDGKKFSPREFLKSLRPERFSDSSQESTTALDASRLEYHLETITNRSQENDFAQFARRIAEKEICPNLLPQTGPTGGGDSKVDSETYPVADDLSTIWVSDNTNAGKERWAFAFSAKKQWKPKVNADIKSIASTARGYTRAFFITNQFVRDKARAEAEDRLSKLYRLDVRSAQVDSVLRELKTVVRQSAEVPGYPMLPLVEVVTNLGEHLGHRSAYDELFEEVVDIASKRKGQIEAAELLLQRGGQYLEKQNAVAAIRCLGRALKRLYKHESRHSTVRALLLCADAYERIGMLWAARGTALTAAAIAVNDFYSYADLTTLQAACSNQMRLVELRLARVPQLLQWHDLSQALLKALVAKGNEIAQAALNSIKFDAVLGCLFLHLEMEQLRLLTKLPAVLDSLELDNSAIALRFALGHIDSVPDVLVKQGSDIGDYEKFFATWRDQPVGVDFHKVASLGDSDTSILESRILGCHLHLTCANESPCVYFAESLLAAIESILSTGIERNIFAREPLLHITVTRNTGAAALVQHSIGFESGLPVLRIQCGAFSPHVASKEQMVEVKNALMDIIGTLLGHVFLIGNVSDALEGLFGDERALERAIDFTGSFITTGNVLGHDPRTTISSWTKDILEDCPLVRERAWNENHRDRRRQPKKERLADKASRPGSAESMPEMLNFSKTKHSQIEVVSLIRDSLWNEAVWVGSGFMIHLGGQRPPILMLIFENQEPACEIFKNW